MPARISRRKLADYAAMRIARGDALEDVLQETAAYLVESGRIREADLVARSIEDDLAARGIVVAHVTSARPLDASAKDTIQRLLHASTIHLSEEVDVSLIGGMRIEAPGKRLDATLVRTLTALSQAKR